MPSWTKDQKLAIEKRGGKIIVSAAAGSGKTAVLSERVINLVLEDTQIDELLIVTFTKAAAEEMKGRIKEKINEAYEKDKSNEYLKRQLSLVDSAKITTMDAFYGDLVKENFEKLGIDKNFNILSNEEENILKESVLKEVLETSFVNVSNYTSMLYMFGANSVSAVKNIILKISSFLDSIPYPDEFIKKTISNYNDKNSFYKELLLKQIRDKMKAYDEVYTEVIKNLYDESEDFDKVITLANKEKNYINDFLVVDSFDELSSRIKTIEFETLRTPKGHKDDAIMIKYKVIRDEFKSDIRKTYKELSFITDEVFEKEQAFILTNLITLFEVVKIYRKRLLEEKKKKNAYSFGDIAHFVVELLIKDGKKTPLAKSVSNRFKEILIDEYQDTNNLQNVIFNAISKDDSNLFIVGDVKQSIYRFRSACPEIFNNDKKNAFKDGFPNLITLSKNFRSRKEVLDFCNFVFENTMTNYFGEVTYDKDEKLYLGASFESGKNLDTEVLIIDGMEKKEDEEDDLTKTQKEAIVVADKIKSLIDNKYQVYDNKKGLWRDIKPSDVVILLRSLKNSSVFAESLDKRGISVYMESSSEYFDNYEVKLIINLLKVIDNPYDDVSLMSILNSSLVRANLNDIARLRSKNKTVSLYETITSSNVEMLNAFINNLNSLRCFSVNHKLHELLNETYKTFDVIPVLSALKGGKKRIKNILQMVNHANKFEEENAKSLHEFIGYLEGVILNKGSLEGVNPLSEGDNVLITTIHKSKGLEYPVVILSETGKNFNFSDVRSDVMINDDLGFACNIKDNEYKLKYESVPMMVFKEQEKSKMLSEELRILYVALTRAKEKIIITGFTNNLTNLVTKASSKIGDKEIISKLYLKGVKNYLDVLIACLLRHPSLRELRSFSMVLPKTFATESKVVLELINASQIDETEFLKKRERIKESFDEEWFRKILNFKYDLKSVNLPIYLSVSEIKKHGNFLRKPNFMNDGVSHTNLGTLYHKILELLPVKKYGISSLKEELEKLTLNGDITKEELNMIKLDNVFAYLTSSVYDELLSSDLFYKEMPINFEIPATYYDNSLKSGNILTSGVIDLLFIKDGVYTIVDYKTDKVSTMEELKEMYKKQLDLYEIGIKVKMNAKIVRKFIYSVNLHKFIEV